TFQVQDDGGTAMGGVDLDPVPKTMTVNVTPVNDAPSGSNKTVTVLEDHTYTFTTADFGFSDPNDSPSNNFLAVKITTSPAVGGLTLNGVAVTAGQVVSAGDIVAGKLKFTPAAHANGLGYASFAFQVQDDGGTANGGVDCDQTPKTLTINVLATKLVVDTTDDTIGGNISSIAALLANKGGDNKISLREAILAINNTPPGSYPVRIEFNIPGTGVHTLTLNSQLPNISKPVIIDATTDDSFAANGNRPAIVLNVNGLANSTGLILEGGASGSTIRGLVITNFTDVGILIHSTSNGNTIAGNYIGGLNANGNLVATNASQEGIVVMGSNNTIGGGATADRNVITPNGQFGVHVSQTTAIGNAVRGNFIGTDASGTVATTQPLAVGIRVANDAAGTTVGGVGAGDGNVIATYGAGSVGIQVILAGSNNMVQGNRVGVSAAAGKLNSQHERGIQLQSQDTTVIVSGNWVAGGTYGIAISGSSNHVVKGNRIGTDMAGTADWGAGSSGISVHGNNNLIGGPNGGDDNIVAFSNASGGGAGISVIGTGTGNTLLCNSIYGTKGTGLGIDLGNDGVTPNDPGDADTGPNNLQNFPVLHSAITDGFQLSLQGALNSKANSYYRIDFFASPTGNASGYGEGKKYLGAVNVATDGSGNASISTILGVSVPAGNVITTTATQTDAGYYTFSDTSEFSAFITAKEVNKAPTGINNTVTTLEDQPYTFSAADFGFTDAGNNPANNLLSVKVTTLPAAGSLTLNGTAVIAGQFVSVTDINSGKLKFTPAADANGAGYPSFTFQVQDDGGTAMGGVDLD
ncbi:MAG: right-handed parallel beta-helix repeat-containing protein, partial [Proteobacteria bacterium]|nr:right-handed parallel beta-helix repeat-containing protein [Pseudomonadota bacterium]